ncbi:hypothetical protein D3C73_961450 [compost metagenome]
MHDLSRFGITECRGFGGLMRGQVGEYSARQGGVKPQGLIGRDDGVTSERRGVPGNAGIRIGASRKVCRQ